MSDTWPRITIVTPTRNAARHVVAAIESVVRQHYPNFEHIVIDNCSSDGTLERLAGFRHLRVVSEADRGAHDAMNKGIGLASGEIIGFLNADDLYTDGLLDTVSRIFADDAATDMVVAPTVVFEDDERGRPKVIVARQHDRDAGLWFLECVFGAPGFNGRFFRRRVFERIGTFDNQYYIAADRHLLLRAILAGVRAHHTGPGVALFYRSHAGSATLNPERRLAEMIGREHVRMAAELAQSPVATPEQRNIFRAWSVIENAKPALRGVVSGQFSNAFGTLTGLTVREPLWPLWLARGAALRRIVRQTERARSNVVIPAAGATNA